ncbi:MAG: hypothetical protein IJY71_00585 [Clostridia bacterium]|nr:hypothetical protein [Clostridia bacterium]
MEEMQEKNRNLQNGQKESNEKKKKRLEKKRKNKKRPPLPLAIPLALCYTTCRKERRKVAPL